MELSKADLKHLSGFGHRIMKQSDEEGMVREIRDTLGRLARVRKVTMVFPNGSDSWREWTANGRGVRSQTRATCSPPVAGTVVTLDPEAESSGYIAVGEVSGKTEPILRLLAPQVRAALTLRAVLERSQKTSLSETELMRATLRARDEERRRIAHELHDDLGQSIVSLKLNLSWIEEKFKREKNVEQALTDLSEARESAGTLLDKIRDLSHLLYPRILDTLGVVPAIEELVYQVAAHSDINAKCAVRGKARPLSKEVGMALYRCCQEAVSNAVRHAEAAEIDVRIVFGRHELRVEVEDNGRGFNPQKLYDSSGKLMSSGFWTIRQRMADLGGAFRVSTAAGRGTVVEMIVPIMEEKVHANGKNKAAHRG